MLLEFDFGQFKWDSDWAKQQWGKFVSEFQVFSAHLAFRLSTDVPYSFVY